MVEFVDTNVHAVLAPNTFSFNWILMSELYIFVVFVKGSFVSMLLNKLCSGVHCCKFRDLFKECHFCQILLFSQWWWWLKSWVCYAVSSGKLLLTFWRGVLCTSHCGVTSQKTWICVSSISIKSFFFNNKNSAVFWIKDIKMLEMWLSHCTNSV